MKHLVLFIITLISASATGQDISGIWQGKLTMEPGGCFPEYFIELQIKRSSRDIEGVSYDYFDTTRFVKLNFTGTVEGNAKKTIVISEKSVVTERIPEDCVPCMKTYNLVYNRRNNEESLSGRWVGEDMGTIAGCPPGNIFLRRVTKSAFEEKKIRKTELTHTIYVDEPDVKVAFYDNGSVDGDSITVFYNGQVVVSKQGLSLRPIDFSLKLEPTKEHQMVVFAETMGTIAPNTSVVIITSGTRRYELLTFIERRKKLIN